MLQEGTYIREPDGALHLYHSPTQWNCPPIGLQNFLDKEFGEGSLWYWRIVTDIAEVSALYEHLGGTHLQPGEYITFYRREVA